MSDFQPDHSDEIDLKELFLAVWAHKFLILVITICAIAISISFAMTRPKIYEAQTVFALKSETGGPSLPSQYSGLAALAGVNLGGSSDDSVFDRLDGQDFILRISNQYRLDLDPYFAPAQSAGLVTTIKKSLGFDTETTSNKDLTDKIVRKFREAVAVSDTKNGSIKVSVSHLDPQVAATLANGIVSQLIDEITAERQDNKEEQLSYLTSQLADALSDVDESKKAVADFAMANSLASQEAFATRTELMARFRKEQESTQEMLSAVEAIIDISDEVSAPTTEDYLLLKARMPIVDDVDFRLLLDLPKAIDAWRWPPKARLKNIQVTLADRQARIQRSISELQEEARQYAVSSDQLATLKREGKVAEATYSVLIEQVKAQALASGYQGKLVSVFQIATPPSAPSEPKVTLIVALGTVLGVMLAAGLSLILSMRSGKLFSSSAISEAAQAQMSANGNAFAPLMKASVKRFEKISAKVGGAKAAELLVMLKRSKSNITVTGATASGLRALPFAYWIARRTGDHTGRTAVLLLDDRIEKGLEPKGTTIADLLDMSELNGIPILTVAKGKSIEDVLLSDCIEDVINSSKNGFDHLVIAASSNYIIAALRTIHSYTPFVITLSKLGQTQRAILEGIHDVSKIDANVSLS